MRRIPGRSTNSLCREWMHGTRRMRATITATSSISPEQPHRIRCGRQRSSRAPTRSAASQAPDVAAERVSPCCERLRANRTECNRFATIGPAEHEDLRRAVCSQELTDEGVRATRVEWTIEWSEPAHLVDRVAVLDVRVSHRAGGQGCLARPARPTRVPTRATRPAACDAAISR